MEDDIRELIIDLVHAYHEEKYEEMDSIYRRMCEESKDIYAGQSRLIKRMEEIEKLINSHAIGVQNVYEKFNEILEEIEKKK